MQIKANYGINSIGLYISSDSIGGGFNTLLNYTPQIIYMPNVPIVDTLNWTKIYGTYKANGSEKYITIGNFTTSTDVIIDSLNTSIVSGASYYYIDDVSVICCDCEDTLNIPNVFTPNGDGVNDVFKIENLPENANVKIYNRWGVQVFESTKPATFWDGRTSGGTECTEGVYYYIINTEEKSYKGYLQLVR